MTTVLFQDEIGLSQSFFILLRGQQEVAQPGLRVQKVRVQLRGFEEVGIGLPPVPGLHLDHAEHVVGLGELGVDLDSVLELKACFDIIAFLVEGLPLLKKPGPPLLDAA